MYIYTYITNIIPNAERLLLDNHSRNIYTYVYISICIYICIYIPRMIV